MFNGTTAPAVASPSPANAYPLSQIENYSAYNGRLSLTIPLHHIGGRGEAEYDMLAVIDTTWEVQKSFNVNGTVSTLSPRIRTTPHLALDPVYISGQDSFILDPGAPSNCSGISQTLVRFQAHWNDDSAVTFRDTGTDGKPATNPYECQSQPPLSYDAGRGSTLQSRDGSQLSFQLDSPLMDPTLRVGDPNNIGTSGVLYTATGLQYRIDGNRVSWMRDRHGNLISFTRDTGYAADDPRSLLSVADPLGRSITHIPVVTTGDCSAAFPCEQIQYHGSAGELRTITIQHGNLSTLLRGDFQPQTYAQLFPSDPYVQNDTDLVDSPKFISSITYPDGSAYTFKYDPYGEVARVTLPTGGAIEYDYGSGIPGTTPEGWDGNNSDSAPIFLYRRLVDRRIYNADGTLSGSTHYSWALEGSNGLQSTQATRDSSGTTIAATTTHFATNPGIERSMGSTDYPYWMWGRPIKIEEGLPVQRTTTSARVQRAPVSWCAEGNLCWLGEPENDPRLAETDVTLNDTNQTMATTFDYDQFNNVTGKYEYDYGQGAAGPLLRHTTTSYVTDGHYTSGTARLLRLPSQINVYAGMSTLQALTSFHYDETDTAAESDIVGHDSGYSNWFRGNLTSRDALIAVGGNAYSHLAYTYDNAGNVLTSADPLGHLTHYSYVDGQHTYAHITAATNALNQSSAAAYDYWTSNVTNTVDVNGVQTTFAYNDPLDRITAKVQAAGTSAETRTTYTYNSPTWITAKADKDVSGDLALRTDTIYDGFGRVASTRQYEGAGTFISVGTSYDVLGRVARVSNPYRNEAPVWTTYQYDALGRPHGTTFPDGSSATTTYSGNSATATDPVGIARSSTIDALGRLTAVVEDPSGANYTTQYTYDVLGDLTKVVQGTQTRTFSYDALGRLLSATQPESGGVTYAYDAAHNLTQKTDSRGSSVTYGYDALNRIVSKTYSDGVTPNVTYTYDNVAYGVGHLTQVSTSRSVTSYTAFDQLGRVTASSQATGARTYNFAYTYNRAGALTSETYPSGRVIQTAYDGANRATQITGTLGSQKTYVTNVNYAPQGAPNWYMFGNNLCRSFTYNSRLQPASSSDSIVYGAAPAGQTCANPNSTLLALSWNWTNANNRNNGNLMSMTAMHAGLTVSQLLAFTETFQYDRLNRLTQAGDSGGWSRAFGYDQYGNMWVTGNSGVPLSAGMPTSNIYTGANRISGASYDATGNQTTAQGDMLQYDAENRIVQVNDPVAGGQMSYVYDGDGRRVERNIVNGQARTYVYDVMGRLVAEYASTPSTTTPLCRTCYLSTDHLGSTRLVTDANAHDVARHDYLPFGEEIPAGYAGRQAAWGVNDSVSQKFTAKERDLETNLDYFGARYYGSALGRFTSPDPHTGTMLHVINPQRWNMYAYGMDNPLSYVDPDGRDAIAVNFSKQVPVGGHEGFFSVHQDGRAQYASFGPQGGGKPSAPGQVKWAEANFTVEFEPNGVPTQASYKQLADMAAKVEGQDPSTVRMNYFKTSELDTAAQDAWIQRIAEASAKGQAPWYDVTRQNCATFCIAGLIQGNAIQNKGPFSLTPNLLFEFLINRAADTYPNQDGSKETVNKTHRNCLIDRDTGKCVQ